MNNLIKGILNSSKISTFEVEQFFILLLIYFLQKNEKKTDILRNTKKTKKKYVYIDVQLKLIKFISYTNIERENIKRYSDQLYAEYLRNILYIDRINTFKFR